MPRPTIADQAATLLARGPLPLGELTDRLVEAGATAARDPRRAVADALRSKREFVGLTGQRWAWVPALLRGQVFTHVLTEDELARGEVDLQPDLGPLCVPFREPVPSNRGELEIRLDSGRCYTDHPLQGPPGWLADLRPGDLLAMSREDDRYSVGLAGDITPAPFVDKRLATELERRLALLESEPGRMPPVVQLAEVVQLLLADVPEAFAEPGPPLRVRVEQAGFEVLGDLVGRPGTDWERWRFADEEDTDDDEDWAGYGLTEQQSQAMSAVLRIAGEVDDRPATDDDVALVTDLLTDPKVVDVLAAVVHDLDEVGGLRVLLRLAPHRAGSLLVLARCEESFAQDLLAEQALRDALAVDPQHEEALLMAARYAEDRGDAVAAIALLRKARVSPQDGQLLRLRPFAEPPDTGISRNVPCPCGSGRKHKACCLRDARHPLAARARWLRAKAVQWALDAPQREEWFSYAAAIAPDNPSEWVPRCLQDAFLQDLGLWGEDLIAEFADSRADLLPADEHALLGEWRDVRAGLYEVVAARRGLGLTLRHILYDALVDVTDKAMSTSAPPGTLLLLRVLPDGGGGFITGGAMSIPRGSRARLVDLLREDPDDLTLATWLGEASRPPTLQTTDGSALVLCTGRWRVRDAGATRRALEAELDSFDDDDSGVVLQGQTVVVQASLNGDELELTTMSRERWVLAERLLTAVAPGAVLLEQQSVPAGELIGHGSQSPPDLDSPEVRQLLRERMLDYERSWVDEPVPALRGLTPREALADPARRQDLLELLADFDSHVADAPDPELAMNPDRIRALLGL